MLKNRNFLYGCLFVVWYYLLWHNLTLKVEILWRLGPCLSNPSCNRMLFACVFGLVTFGLMTTALFLQITLPPFQLKAVDILILQWDITWWTLVFVYLETSSQIEDWNKLTNLTLTANSRPHL